MRPSIVVITPFIISRGRPCTVFEHLHDSACSPEFQHPTNFPIINREQCFIKTIFTRSQHRGFILSKNRLYEGIRLVHHPPTLDPKANLRQNRPTSVRLATSPKMIRIVKAWGGVPGNAPKNLAVIGFALHVYAYLRYQRMLSNMCLTV